MNHSAEYRQYLESEHWHALRLSALNRANRKCEACSDLRGLNGHHLIYRQPLTDGIPEDIMALCERCHDMWHDWINRTGNRLQNFTREATRGGLLVLLSRLPRLPRLESERKLPKYKITTPPPPRLDRLSSKQRRWLRAAKKRDKKAANKAHAKAHPKSSHIKTIKCHGPAPETRAWFPNGQNSVFQ